MSGKESRKVRGFGHRTDLLASIVESSDDAIISFLLNGTVLSWNQGAEELFGYSVESTMGKRLHQLIGPEMVSVIEALKRGEKLDTFEISYVAGDGHTYQFSTRVFPIRDEDDVVRSGAAIFRDISQAKQAEKQLLLTSEQLARSNKELEEFAWVAAHDLKEPVRTMGTYSKLLLSEYAGELDEDGEQFLQYINQASLKAIRRIDDVLKFSALRRKKLELDPVDLSEVVANVLEDIGPAIDESKAKIKVMELPVVAGSRENLESLFQNVISNAIKYRGSDKPEIVIDAEKRSEDWLIAVKDNGIGFKQENATKIFKMFHRLHDEDEYPGTGLGLSICKKIIELHGGKIWAESSPGAGSTFFFTLPSESKMSA